MVTHRLFTVIPQCLIVNGVKTFTRTFTVTDEQGNTQTCTQIINVTDLANPIFNEALPQNITVSCTSLVPAAATLTATDKLWKCGSNFCTKYHGRNL